MSTLENEIEALRSALADLAERVRADAVADDFLTGTVEWRVGDYFVDDCTTHRIDNISSDGKWTCGSVEARPMYWSEAARLYTSTEVAAIVAKAKGAVR